MPQLANSWSLSDDKRTYTFQLQDNVTWHDGKPFTADDVIFSLMKFIMKLSPRARRLCQNQGRHRSRPHTVTLTLDTPFEPFLLMFDVTAAVIVPSTSATAPTIATTRLNQHPIGTGPFQYTEWQRGSFIRMKRYDGYWKSGQPYLDEIIWRIVPDSQSRGVALQTGQVQMCTGSHIEPFDIPPVPAAAEP